MITIRDHVKQKARLPVFLVLVAIAGIALTLGILRGTAWEGLIFAFGLLLFVAAFLFHVSVTCPRCHMPFRSALNWVIFDLGGISFRYCPNCGCKLDDQL